MTSLLQFQRDVIKETLKEDHPVEDIRTLNLKDPLSGDPMDHFDSLSSMESLDVEDLVA
eukprot:CAMPEP_0170507518 /NCGR_PEP_ID=MMETSP0208-20121228/59106_1 /TAXON_ID=197538 /ORGANISM="Strombidium inclinatum, Strain S3" /LENGTH=58 /DNA_ID=CAMNT_0010789751 /DNA_START=63 /DNA_END=239 /DNA_ORIENTATION=-